MLFGEMSNTVVSYEELLETENSASYKEVILMKKCMKRSISKMIGREISEKEWKDLDDELSKRWDGYIDWINC